jgi:hypothetical protein
MENVHNKKGIVAIKNKCLETSGGLVKYEGNPVMGGKHGTCFDISVLKEGDIYRMWLSWRPKMSLAIVESKDGLHWSEPPKIVLEPREETGWENIINRPGILKRADGYHLWYTGQTEKQSWIGYATSPDGVTWKRMSDKSVLSPDKPGKNVTVMCPHVIWDDKAQFFKILPKGENENLSDARELYGLTPWYFNLPDVDKSVASAHGSAGILRPLWPHHRRTAAPPIRDFLRRTRVSVERGKDYNHSTYCDLIITGLIGLRPRVDESVEVNPLVPEGTWEYFCLDRVPYHGRTLTILWDKTGERYHKGKGLRVYADGREIAAAETLGRLTGALPPNLIG